MKNLFKRISYLLICAVMLFSITACANHEDSLETLPVDENSKLINDEVSATREEVVIETETETETEEETVATSSFPLVREEVDGMIRSYLTGEMVPVEQGMRRPLAIMMSNDKEARPQYGMNRAGIVYEAPVEGGMNRYMSVIEDFDDLDRIGSVRSCRTYYTYFAREWDAIYAHFGQSTFAKPYLENVDNINGIEGLGSTAYFRSKDKKSPHNAYASAEGIFKAAEKLVYSWEYAEDYQGHFLFAEPGEVITPDESISLEAFKLVPGYVYNKPWFEYNEEDGLYHRFQYEDVHEGSEGPIEVKNVIFQYSPAAHYATTAYLNINVHEDSYGYYFTNGRCVPVSFHKDGEFGVTHYYDPEGNEIRLNNGKTWICIITTSCFEDTEIYDRDGNRTN